MNYSAHYARLINRARSRVLDGYCERHHVMPRCIGGTDDPENLVDLTPEEHYIAHQLLVKMHPSSPGLVWAAIRQARESRGNKAYGWLRRRNAQIASAQMRGDKRNAGKKLSAAHREKISRAMTGRTFSSYTRLKLSEAFRGRYISPEARAKISLAFKGKKLPPRSAEYREKMAALKRGKKRAPRSPEWIANHAAAVRAAWDRKRRTAGM